MMFHRVLVSLNVAYLSSKVIKTGSLDATSAAAMHMAVLERATPASLAFSDSPAFGFWGVSARMVMHDMYPHAQCPSQLKINREEITSVATSGAILALVHCLTTYDRPSGHIGPLDFTCTPQALDYGRRGS